MLKSLELKNFVTRHYKRIRDMPFEVRLGKVGYHEDLAYIKAHKRGSCSSKHYLLGSVCEREGLQVTYLTYPFYWNELDVNYPDFIRRLAEEIPLTYHLAIEVCIGKEEFFLDATWDPPLEKAGFPVNKIGHELTNMKNAVIPSDEPIIHSSASERSRFVEKLVARMVGKGVEHEFYTAFNQWLEEVRKI